MTQPGGREQGAPRAQSASRPPSFPMRRAGGRGEVIALAPPLHAARMCRPVLSDTDPPAVSSDPKTGESRSACARREADEHQGPDLAVAVAFHLERLLAVERTEKLTCRSCFGSCFSPRLSSSFLLGAGGQVALFGALRSGRPSARGVALSSVLANAASTSSSPTASSASEYAPGAQGRMPSARGTPSAGTVRESPVTTAASTASPGALGRRR